MIIQLLADIDPDRASAAVFNGAWIIAGIIVLFSLLGFYFSISEAAGAVKRMEATQKETNALLARIAEANEAMHQEMVAARVKADKVAKTQVPFRPSASGVQAGGSGGADS